MSNVFIERSLRVGHPLPGAVEMIAEELEPPVSTIFSEICQQQALGMTLEESLRKVAVNSTSSDMRLFATAVAIQLRTGGNLADMMERLATVMRQRMRLARRVRVLTMQTQFSKRILIALPIVMFGILSLTNPKYMSKLYATEYGQIALGLAAAMMLLGTWMMNRMATLEY